MASKPLKPSKQARNERKRQAKHQTLMPKLPPSQAQPEVPQP